MGARPMPEANRWIWLVLAIALVVLGAFWATEPLRRREILFETSVRITPGARVAGEFELDAAGPFAVQLRFDEAWSEPLSEPSRGGEARLQALSEDIGGGFGGKPSPPGFAASYAVSHEGAVVSSGVTGDRFEGFWGPTEVGVTVAWIDGVEPSTYSFEVQIRDAVPGLGRWHPRLVVAAAGDRISYARLEAFVRGAIAVVVAIVAIVATLILHAVTSTDRSPSDSGA